MNRPQGTAKLMRLFSSAVLDQAMLSAVSLLVGLVLIRRCSEEQYGYYVLALNALLLFGSLQGAFFAPPLINRMAGLDAQGRRDVVGGLYRSQQQILRRGALGAVAVAAAAWMSGLATAQVAVLMAAVAATGVLTLNREYFRMTLQAYHRPTDVLKADSVYALLLLLGGFAATFTPLPALATVCGLGLAAIAGGSLLARTLRRSEPWNPQGEPDILQQIARLGLWSTAGAGVHWAFSQGYSYLVAATLDVSAVAAIAATRLLMMPVNLLSSGLSAQMLPMASGWLQQHSAATVLRRLMLFATLVAAVALAYFAVLWLCRNWVFEHLLRKSFAQRDPLLLLWGAAFLLMTVRDQLIYVLVARSRFRQLTGTTLASALLSLAASYFAMRALGQIGAPLGVLVGELVSVAGVLALSLREVERPVAAAPCPEA